MNMRASSLVMRKGTRRSCRQGLIVSLGLSRCLAGAIVLSCVVVTVLVASGLAVKSLLRAVSLCIPYLSQTCSNHGFQVEGRISLIVAAQGRLR